MNLEINDVIAYNYVDESDDINEFCVGVVIDKDDTYLYLFDFVRENSKIPLNHNIYTVSNGSESYIFNKKLYKTKIKNIECNEKKYKVKDLKVQTELRDELSKKYPEYLI